MNASDEAPSSPPRWGRVSRGHRLGAALILAAYVALAVAYSIVNPIYESTDELHHYRYVQYLRATGQLPVQGGEGARIQAHHPPLYYALAALASGGVPLDRPWDFEPAHNPFWQYRVFEVGGDNKNFYFHSRDEDFPYRGAALAAHVARWVNVLLGAAAVWLTYLSARRLVPHRPAASLASMSLIAFNPQFLYMSGAINNDVIAGSVGAAVLYVCLGTVGRPLSAKRAAALGALFGLGLLSKFNLLFMLPVVVLSLVLARRPEGWTRFARRVGVAALAAGLMAGWWFVRNVELYGEPTGIETMNAIWGGRDPGRSLQLAVQEIPYSWSTLWGRFGYGQIPMPDAVYQGIFIACVAALAGLVLGAARRWRTIDPVRRAQFAVLLATVGLFTIAVFGYMMVSTAGPNGRFFFPALPALAILLALGWCEWLRPRDRVSASVIIGGALMFALYGLFGILGPAYARPQPLSQAQIAAIPNPGEMTFGDSIRLAGYAVDKPRVLPGESVTIDVYWQARQPIDRSYAVFVHVAGDDGVIEAQRDTYPGLGNYPTMLWQPGEVFVDHYRVDIPATAYAPLETTVRVGLVESGGARLPASNGEDSIRVGQVSIVPRQGVYPNSTRVNFADQVELLGYTLDRRSVHPGESLTLTTVWRASRPADVDYRLFAHIADPSDPATIWARTTHGPVNDARPLSTWQPGEVVVDERVLTVDPNTPPGTYELQIGWFGRPSSQRLQILAEDGHGLGTYLPLTRVRVEEETGD